MDQGLKERLIGAAVLVALGVWLIPWVLDGPQQQSESRPAGLQLPVPEEPAPVRSQTIRLDEEHDPPGSAAAGAAPESLHRAADTSDDQPTSAAGANATASAQPHAQALPQDPVASQSLEPPAPHPVETRTNAPSTAQTGWTVQLGSFSEEENARRLAQRVATYGYTPDISNHRASGRVMYRVRVGPHESRSRADAAASALSAHGFVAQVVAAD